MPFIVSWPGAIEPGISNALISQVDLLASFAALTGAVIPSGHARDSRNLLDALTGKSMNGREQVVQQGVGIEALRRGDWKYLPPGQFAYRNEAGAFSRETIAEPGALYYLPEDSSEQNNLAARYPNIAREMRAALEKELGRSAVRSKGGAAER
jgi:arylsulfatase A-like enzyme